MHDANADLWAMLSDEELAEQADQWRYAAENHARRGRYGLARWSWRLSNDALTELNTRQQARAELACQGEQLHFTEAEYRHVFEPGA